MSSGDVSRALRRVAHEILERNKGADGLVVLGIPTRGVALARRLVQVMAEVEGVTRAGRGASTSRCTATTCAGSRSAPIEHTDIPAPGIDDRTVVLVDDVLFSGRTVRAALDSLADLGRPRAVRLAVLVDRGHRDLPIRADHVGKNLPTSSSERVQGAAVRARRRGRGPHQRGEPLMRHLLSMEDLEHRRDPRAAHHRRVDARRAAPRGQEAARRCAGAPSSTSSSRTPPAPGPPSRSPASGSRPTSSTSPARGPPPARGSRCATPR